MHAVSFIAEGIIAMGRWTFWVVGQTALAAVFAVIVSILYVTLLLPQLTLMFDRTLYGHMERALVAQINANSEGTRFFDLNSVAEQAIPIGVSSAEAKALLDSNEYASFEFPPGEHARELVEHLNWVIGASDFASGANVSESVVLSVRRSRLAVGIFAWYAHHVLLHVRNGVVVGVAGYAIRQMNAP